MTENEDNRFVRNTISWPREIEEIVQAMQERTGFARNELVRGALFERAIAWGLSPVRNSEGRNENQNS